jgi:hypothetical protein
MSFHSSSVAKAIRVVFPQRSENMTHKEEDFWGEGTERGSNPSLPARPLLASQGAPLHHSSFLLQQPIGAETFNGFRRARPFDVPQLHGPS